MPGCKPIQSAKQDQVFHLYSAGNWHIPVLFLPYSQNLTLIPIIENDGIILCTAEYSEFQSFSLRLLFIALIKGGVWSRYIDIISIINEGLDFVRCSK
jgi:hypothetical protein